MIKKSVYTDGSSSGKSGLPGGYAAIILEQGKDEVIVSGGSRSTTNNRMELTAAIEGIKAATGADHITVFSDSQYVVNGFNKNWVNNWKNKGWMKKRYKGGGMEPVKNSDLWKELNILCQGKLCTVKWIWVKAHAGNEYNERCDILAKEACEAMKHTPSIHMSL